MKSKSRAKLHSWEMNTEKLEDRLETGKVEQGKLTLVLSYTALKHLVLPLLEAGHQTNGPQADGQSYGHLSSCPVVIVLYLDGQDEVLMVCQQALMPCHYHLPLSLLSCSLACSWCV